MEFLSKKSEKKVKNNWKLLIPSAILFALFAPLCTGFAKDKTDSVSVKVRLADPETEGMLTANREKLAKLESENVRLRAENVQVKTENDRLKREQLRLVNEFKSSLEENSVLRKELIETLNKYSSLADRQKRLSLSAAGIIESMNPTYVGGREAELLSSLSLTLKSGNELLLKSSAVYELLQSSIADLKLDPVNAAKLRLALNEMRDTGEKFAMLNSEANQTGSLGRCRILELNEKLKIIVVSAGFRQGLKSGMTLTAGANGEFLFRMVDVRPFVGAAILEKGDFRLLTPGMELRSTEKQ